LGLKCASVCADAGAMTAARAHWKPHNWLYFRIADPEIAAMLRAYARGRLADIGCGAKPYAALSRGLVDAHVGIDRPGSRHGRAGIDLGGDAQALPVEDASFRTILCTDVLEHRPEPGAAVAEAWRILEPGGYAIYTVPLHWHVHEEPHDFYRFTRHGLRHLFEKHGFEVVELRALTGFVATFAQALVYWLHEHRGSRRNPLHWLVPPLAHAIQALALLAHRLDRSEKFTAEYLAVVRKPAGHPA
jgi:SAM-dependent methyltransferase